jgi:hypothetical protein
MDAVDLSYDTLQSDDDDDSLLHVPHLQRTVYCQYPISNAISRIPSLLTLL